MNLEKEHYSQYALVREMMDTIDVVKNFDPGISKVIAGKIKEAGRLFLTGEGSSRIFPAKNAIRKAQTWGIPVSIATDGSRQAAQYNLDNFAVFCASNSGRTKEVVLLAKKLAASGNKNSFGLTANNGTVLSEEVEETFVLNCGWEQAVAATKSVVEQALFYQSIITHIGGADMAQSMTGLSDKIEKALTLTIDNTIVEKAKTAPIIYFAGYNDGVAEELTLKTNEITRKKSDFLEGPYAVHGLEEVMNPDEEIEKFQEVLVKGVGLTVVAIADHKTPFPTIIVPEGGEMAPYIYLCAGWNLLVEIGLGININLDKPERARKVGNEFLG